MNPVQLNYNENYTRITPRNLNAVDIKYINTEYSEPHIFTSKTVDDLKYENATILEKKKLSATWRDIYSVKLDKEYDFTPGDSIGIFCQNSRTIVEDFMELLNFKNYCVSIERKGANQFTFTGYLYYFFLNYYDFTSIPKKITLMNLSKTCDENNRKKIEYLCSREGVRDYLKIHSNWNNIIDIITTFNCKPSLEDLIIDCEIIKPRYYSLTNEKGKKAEILVGIMKKRIYNDFRYGHVSNFISNTDCSEVKITLRKNLLFSIKNEEKILAICIGSGIAPFLSFSKNMAENQSIWMIYGFRNIEDDLSGDIKISSRIKISKVMSSENRYVTDFIKQEKEIIKKHLENSYSVYVCGKMAMQKAVFDFFKSEFSEVIENKKIFFDNWS